MRKQFVGNELSLGDKYLPMMTLKPTKELSAEESSETYQQDQKEIKIIFQKREDVKSESSYDVNKSYASAYSGAKASARSNSLEENKEKHKVKWNDMNKGSITHISPILEHNKAMEATANSSNSDGKGNV